MPEFGTWARTLIIMRMRGTLILLFDLVINTGSMQEMPENAVKFWMRFIQDAISVRGFYSFNYFLNDKRMLNEADRGYASLITPICDPFWRVETFEINPRVVTVDADWRNWLEVCLIRTSRDHDPSSEACRLYREAMQYPKASDYWFQNIWMAIWCTPDEAYVREMIEGIELFKSGVRAAIPVNHHMKPPEDYLLSRFPQGFAKYAISRLRIGRFDEFDELRFYRKLLERGSP